MRIDVSPRHPEFVAELEAMLEACREIEASGRQVSALALARHMGINPDTAGYRLARLRREGLVAKRPPSSYAPPRGKDTPNLTDAQVRERIARVRAATEARGRFLAGRELDEVLGD